MNPRLEAEERLGGRYEVRILEPSPPAIEEPPWFADDPVAIPSVPAGRPLVAPVSNGDRTWDELCFEEHVYVAPWSTVERSAVFSATAFVGAELNYKELLAAGDQRRAALEFLRRALEELRG